MRRKPATIPFESLWPICEAARACHVALERLEVLAVRGLKRGEQTSPEVASIAGKYMAMTFEQFTDRLLTVGKARRVFNEIRTLAASDLTQAADKPKRNKIVRGLEAAIDHATGHKPGKITRIKVRKP